MQIRASVPDRSPWLLGAAWLLALPLEWGLLRVLPSIPVSGQESRRSGGEWEWVVRHEPAGDLANFVLSLLLVGVPVALFLATRRWMAARAPAQP